MALSIGQLAGYLTLDDSKFQKGLDSAKSDFKKAGDWLKEHGKQIGLAGGAAAGAAVGVGIVKNMEIGAGRAKLQAQLGLTGKDAQRAGQVAGRLYSGDFAGSLEDANAAIKGVVQNMNVSVKDVNLESLSAKALAVANTFDQDLGGTTAAVGQLMKTGLAKNATEALDLITAGMQGGVNKADDLLDTVTEYSTVFRDAGISGEDAMSLMSQGLKAGARDADTVADALKEFAIRAQDGSDTSAAGFKAIGLNAKDMTAAVAAGGPRARKALDKVLDGLQGMKDPAERNAAAVALFGTKAEDLGDALFALDLDKPAAGMGKIAGSTQRVLDVTGDTAQSKITSMKNKFELWTASLVEVDGPLGTVAAGVAAFGGSAVSAVGPLVAMIAATRSSRAATAAATAATNAGTVAQNRSKIATIASKAVQLGVTAATKTWTIAQRALNLALRMNPIGIVITVLAALVAGLIIAYKKSETFRDIVQGAWMVVREAVSIAWNKYYKPIFKAIWGALKFGWERFRKFGGIIEDVWDAITSAFKAAKSWVVDRFKAMWAVVKRVVTDPVEAARDAVRAAWDKISDKFTAAKDWVKGAFQKAWDGIKAVLTAPVRAGRDEIRDLWDAVTDKFTAAKEWVAGAFQRAWNGIKAVLLSPLHAARDAFRHLLGHDGPIRGAFSRAVGAIGRIWEGLKRLAAKPVNFIIGTVYNNGIRKAMNLIPGVDLAAASKISFATGGTVPGSRYPYGDKVLTHLAPGEEVISNNRGQADRFRSLLKRINGYAGGGTVWPVPGHDTGTYPGHDGVDINRGSGWDDYGDPIRAAADGIISYVGWGRGYGQAIFERGPYGELVYGHTSAALARAGQRVTAGTLIGRVGSTGNSSAPHLHFGFPGGTTAQALAFLSGASVSSAGGSAAGGWWDVLSKAWGAVTSLPEKFGAWGSLFKGGMGSIWDTIKAQVSKYAGAAKVGADVGLSSSTIPGLSAVASLFDMGGLANGAGLMVKGPKPERVLSPRQTEAFERLVAAIEGGGVGAGVTAPVYVNAPQGMSPRELAREIASRQHVALARVGVSI